MMLNFQPRFPDFLGESIGPDNLASPAVFLANHVIGDDTVLRRLVFKTSSVPLLGMWMTVTLLFLSPLGPARGLESNIRGCLGISDVNERIECLESRGRTQPPNPTFQAPIQSSSVSPSFDCRAARSSIERAICSDPELSELDARMGQAYQDAARLGVQTQVLLNTQRQWIGQRDVACSSASGILFSCLAEMTRQRTSSLSDWANSVRARAQQLQQTVPTATTSDRPATKEFADRPVETPTTPAIKSDLPTTQFKQSAPSASSRSPSSPPSPSSTSAGGSGGLVALLILIGAAWIAFMLAQRTRRRRALNAKYGEQNAARILARQVWQGMSEDQLIASWGSPADISTEIKRTKSNETWKYNRTGKNRFRNRVYLENGIVIGWKD